MIEFRDQMAQRQLVVLDPAGDLGALPRKGVQDVGLFGVGWDDLVCRDENKALVTVAVECVCYRIPRSVLRWDAGGAT